MLASESQYLATTIAVNLRRNIKMLDKTFADDDYLLSAVINFPNLPPGTINYVLFCNWLTDGLELNNGKLNQYLSVLNFLALLQTLQILKISAS